MTDGPQATNAQTPAPAPSPAATEELVWLGSDRPSILVAGQSNRSALQVAISEGLDNGTGAVLTTSGPKLGVVITGYWMAMARADPTLPLAICYAGNEYNVGFLFDAARPFTFLHPAENHRDGMEIVPIEAVRDCLDDVGGGSAGQGLVRVLELLRGRRVVLIAPPPPKSEQLVREGLAREGFFIPVLEQHGWTVELAPIARLSLRIALRQVMVDSYLRIASTYGVEVLEFPSQTVNADGSLKAEYSRSDATHANAQYGALVWRQLADYFDVPVNS